MLEPFPAERMRAYPVSAKVNGSGATPWGQNGRARRFRAVPGLLRRNVLHYRHQPDATATNPTRSIFGIR
jgi:hypothetical protein